MTGAVPRHVGVILDGNGRWAQRRGLPRVAGHVAGERALTDVLEAALDVGVEWFTIFVFSTENWRRSEAEVAFLMEFCDELILKRGQELSERGARLHFAGDLDDPRIPSTVRQNIRRTLDLTASNNSLHLVVAFNYGGRREITEAARILAADAVAGRIRPEEVDEQAIAARLHVPHMPDVDLIIRTSGENRLSNFLLWQGAYAELYFTEVLWPDFDGNHFRRALAEYQSRDRRFGRIPTAAASQPTSPDHSKRDDE